MTSTHNVLNSVRDSCANVVMQSEHVTIDLSNIGKEILNHLDLYTPRIQSAADWASDFHYSNHKEPELTARYVLVLSALNFCFWRLPTYEYVIFAKSLKQFLETNPEKFTATYLKNIKTEELPEMINSTKFAKTSPRQDTEEKEEGGPPKRQRIEQDIPLLGERTRLLNEVGRVLDEKYNGKASEFINSAQGSAVKLVQIVAAELPGFRDHAIYKGQQIFIYKRAQILVADLWGAFGRDGLGAFHDIDQLTCFADYRVPQILRHLNILKYSNSLAEKIKNKQELPYNSQEEVEIRAATIHAVEKMLAVLKTQGREMISVELDWILWERGYKMKQELDYHHRTLSIFY